MVRVPLTCLPQTGQQRARNVQIQGQDHPGWQAKTQDRIYTKERSDLKNLKIKGHGTDKAGFLPDGKGPH